LAQGQLAFPALQFVPADINLIGSAFAGVMRDTPFTCYACAIMPDHVHLVIRKHRHLPKK
jgi:REP element-mobilizing transposase RayT